MKKLFCILLTLAMLLSAVALAETADFAGEWLLTAMTEGETEYNPADFGMEMALILDEDGTATMTTTGEEDMTGTWAAVEAGVEITIDGEPLVFALVDGALVADADGMDMVFEKLGLTGTWYLLSLVQGETEYSPADVGMEMALVLAEDGTATMTTTGEDDMVGTWAETETGVEVTIEGEALPFTLMDGNLVVDNSGMVMVFGREAADTFNPGNAIVANAIEEFNGTWNCIKIDMMDMVMPAEGMGLSSMLTIDNGAVTQENHYTDAEFWGEDKTLTGNGELMDGSLTLTGEGLDDSVATLYDSGILAVVQPYQGILEMTYYYELAE